MSKRKPQAALDELLDDPIVAMLMRSDGIERHCLLRLLDRVGQERARAAAAAAAGGSRR